MNKELFDFWLNNIDEEDKEILLHQTDNEDSFYKELEFGTAGLRGKLGMGPNRMNKYIVRKTTLSFYKYLHSHFTDLDTKGIVISHDNRHGSREFALEVAKVFCYFDVKVYLFPSLRPTPYLSFAVRSLHARGGVMITASHNTKEYNGYKVYDETGCQLVPSKIEEVIGEMEKIENIFDVPTKALEHCHIIDPDLTVRYEYFRKLTSISYNKLNASDYDKVLFAYTPLHGTGSTMIPTLLDELGYRVRVVEEQMINDPNFSTVPTPNPEDPKSFEYVSKLGKRIKAQVLLSTDPDADRMGVAIYDESIQDYHYLTGNQTGALILSYLAQFAPRNKKGNDYVFNTIVTSEIAKLICTKNNLILKQTLTGFKYIGEQAHLLEQTNDKFFFGYEESYGCVVKDFVRDKDAIQACLILAEMACYYSRSNKTLYDCLCDLYQEYGYFKDEVISYTFEGMEGISKMNSIMDSLRAHPFAVIAEKTVTAIEDYQSSNRYNLINKTIETIDLPKSNVMKYYLKDAGWICFRPSGTEPKLKVYCSIYEPSINQTLDTFNLIKDFINIIINN